MQIAEKKIRAGEKNTYFQTDAAEAGFCTDFKDSFEQTKPPELQQYVFLVIAVMGYMLIKACLIKYLYQP